MVNGKTALITGASQGIGYELARCCAEDGYNLILVARSREKLAVLARELETRYKIKVTASAKDLSDPNAVQDLYKAIQERQVPIDILINNAGFGLHGSFLHLDLKEQLDMIQVNVVSVTALTHLIAQDMIKQKKGFIMNVSSTAAFQPGPYMAVYYASKSYVLSFSEALHDELKKHNIVVTALCPGPTKTGFQKRANTEQIKMFKTMMDPRTVAKLGYEGMKNKKSLVIPGLKNKTLSFFAKIAPGKLGAKIVSKIHQNK